MKSFWGRVGTTITVTDEELDILCGENRDAAETLLVKILRDPAKSRIDGETYFPEEALHEEDERICESDFYLSEIDGVEG